MLNLNRDTLFYIRNFGQILASILKSSYLGIFLAISTLFLNKKLSLNKNTPEITIIFIIPLAIYCLLVYFLYSDSFYSFARSIILWFLPLTYYLLNSKSIDSSIYKKILVIIVIFGLVDYFFINFTSISFFDDDRLRAKGLFGLIRTEGVSHNSSISSATIVAVYLKTFFEFGFSRFYFIMALIGIVITGSGVGFLLFSLVFLLFILNRKYQILFLLLALFFLLTIFFLSVSVELGFNLPRKISLEYISYLVDLKLQQLTILINSEDFLMGKIVTENIVITSGDFGIFSLFALGFFPALLLLNFLFYLFYRTFLNNNASSFFVLFIANLHYPVLVDPFSAFIMANLAVERK